jgi:hypothetical protein
MTDLPSNIRVQDLDHCGMVAGICDEMNLVEQIDALFVADAALYTKDNLKHIQQLRWVFQCFMSIHLVSVAQIQQITNLTSERLWILNFFGAPCRKYYLLC